MPKSKKHSSLKTDFVNKSVAKKIGILTLPNLLSEIQELRQLVINNCHRIPSFRSIADKLGSIETLIIDSQTDTKPLNTKQQKLPNV